MAHIPVLQKEVIEYLDPKPNQNFIDCTIGEAGHTILILEKNKPQGKVLGIEIDQKVYQELKLKIDKFKFSNRLILVNDSFINLENIVKKNNFKPVNGILFDLGMSSWQIEKSERGFSFKKDEPLIMSYNTNSYLTAQKILNEFSEQEIEFILKNYGEERFSKRIAKEIVETRKLNPIKTTFQLTEIVKRATPAWYHHKKINPATKTFQALRIAVNDELNNLKKVLPQTLKILEPGAKIAIISFHSLEDRIVKNFFKEKEKEGKIKILTKKPILPKSFEIKINPRARSAKLRVVKIL